MRRKKKNRRKIKGRTAREKGRKKLVENKNKDQKWRGKKKCKRGEKIIRKKGGLCQGLNPCQDNLAEQERAIKEEKKYFSTEFNVGPLTLSLQ